MANNDSELTRSAFDNELEPRGIVEQTFVNDVVVSTWEILRQRRCKAALINTAFRAALSSVLRQMLSQPGEDVREIQEEAENLALAWFSDQDARKTVAAILRDFQLDESAIAAEAVRTSIEDIERFERLLASAKSRRNRALATLAEIRAGLGLLLRERSDHLIESQSAALENKNKSAA